jgi:flagellar operon protein
MDPRLMIGPQGPQLGGIALKGNSGKIGQSNGLTFSDLFNQALNPVSPQIRISAHAQKRLDERNIAMTENLENSLNSALNELSAKGARDSLVITSEGAFLVNVPNRTMITAMGLDEMRDGIVTNIDSVSMKYR